VKISVVGLGNIGLPLAVQFARQGHRVIGTDVDRCVGNAVRESRPLPSSEHLNERLADLVAAGTLEATTETTAAAAAVDSATEAIGAAFVPGPWSRTRQRCRSARRGRRGCDLGCDPSASLVRAAREVNRSMPERCADLLAGEHGSLTGAVVVVLGASYRVGVTETAYSAVFETVDALRRRGAAPLLQDPLYTPEEIRSFGLDPYMCERRVDAAVVQTDHPAFARSSAADLPGAVPDSCGELDPELWQGVSLVVLGRGGRERKRW
jgi:UDP-N-acetyl-D-mannosaminuronate dehydrogenase